MGEIKIAFRGRKALPDGTIRDYGKYGRYEKKGSKWIRLKSGYPMFRKTLDYKKIKKFLLSKGYCDVDFFKDKGVKILRGIIEDKFKKEYEANGRR